MAFLTKDDLKTVSTPEVIDLITGSDDTIVTTIITECTEIAKSYLHRYYDTQQIFSQSGTDRSQIVLKYLKDMVVHEIYIRRTRNAMNEVAAARYEEAMLWLDKVSSGKIDPDLPRKQVDTDGDGNADADSTFMKMGSRKSYKNHW